MFATSESYRRIARPRAPLFAVSLLALFGCGEADVFNADSSTPPEVIEISADSVMDTDAFSFEADTPVAADDGRLEAIAVGPDAPEAASASFAGGIAIGLFHLPNNGFGSRYNGAVRNIYPDYLVSNLRAIKERGGKVVLSLAGSENNFKDADGNFSLTKWKARVSRFRNVNFSSYVSDGTVIGHYLIDEPHDKANWNGKTVPQSTLEEMARYSKSIWPGMVTIVRSWPDYLDDWSGSYQYLDAAWAQYSARFGSVSTFISTNVSKAKGKGLALVVGLNIMRGGNNASRMTASQVQSWGSTLLSSTYPCAFLSWEYNSSYLSTSSMQEAMSSLRQKAQSRSTRTCRG